MATSVRAVQPAKALPSILTSPRGSSTDGREVQPWKASWGSVFSRLLRETRRRAVQLEKHPQSSLVAVEGRSSSSRAVQPWKAREPMDLTP